ncbi:MAG TPA: ABC transporter permease [Anaeromyxobacter sp.]|nr:ABC transporter permease [Anaeromyxobacter sp.]
MTDPARGPTPPAPSAGPAPSRTAPLPRRAASSGFFRSRELSLALVIAAAFAVLWILKGGIFFSLKNFEGIATGIVYDLLMAAGMTVVLILWGIDLSVGAVLALTSVVAAMMMHAKVAIAPSVAAGLLCALAIGAVNGACVAYLRIAPFIVTLAAMSVARGAALVLSSGYFVSGLPPAYSMISEGRLGGIPVPYLLVAVVLLTLHLLLRRWRFLHQAFYVGTNPAAAALSGINASLVTFVGYLISALTAGIAAILMSSKLAMGFSQFGQLAELRAIAAAVIGGASFTGGSGSILGATLGVILIAIINNGFVLLHGSPNWQQAVSGIILLVAVGVDAVRTRRERRD